MTEKAPRDSSVTPVLESTAPPHLADTDSTPLQQQQMQQLQQRRFLTTPQQSGR